jgi:DNA-binding FadR family transcriptional regulator
MHAEDSSAIKSGQLPLLERSLTRGLRKQVVWQLGLGIVSGRYPPEMILPLDTEFLELFGVSRTIMREASHALAAKGLIEARARVGTKVLPRRRWNLFDSDVLAWHFEAGPDADFLRSLSEIRLGIELQAAELAAERRQDSQAAAMLLSVDRMERARSSDEFARADLVFHQLVAEASGNVFMQSISALVEVALASTFKMSSPVADPAAHAVTVGTHRAIAEAIRDRRGADARAAMRKAIYEGYSRAAGDDAAAPIGPPA